MKRGAWLIVGALYAIWIAARGPIAGADTFTYSRWADALIASRFNLAEFFSRETFMVPLPLYVAWLSIVAAAKLVATNSWPLVILGVNAVAMFAIARAVLSVARDGIPSYAAAAALLLATDFLLFAPYVLSDVAFAALCAITLANLIQSRRGRATATTALACLMRPTSPPLLAVLLARLSGLTRWVAQRERDGTVVLAGVALLICLVHAYLIQHPEWTPTFLNDWMSYVRSGYAAGGVITDRPLAYIGAVATIPGIVGLTLLKWAAFFSPWAPGYSVPHTVLNLVFFVPIYLAGVYTIRHARDREAVATLVLYILCVSGFHALQEIDFDHRFRLPIVPALIMLATLRLDEPLTELGHQPRRL